MCTFLPLLLSLFFFNDTATTEIYTLSLHDALPICIIKSAGSLSGGDPCRCPEGEQTAVRMWRNSTISRHHGAAIVETDRKSTRLNSSHVEISYAVFCLKKKKKKKKNKQ